MPTYEILYANKNIKYLYNLGRKGYISSLYRKSPQESNEISCWTAGVTLLYLAIGKTFLRTGFLVNFYDDDISPSLLK